MSAKTSSITEPYFSHDLFSREDKQIKLLIEEMGFEGYGLFWAIVPWCSSYPRSWRGKIWSATAFPW